MYGNLSGIGRATTNRKGFRVFINEGELNQIYDWVLTHDDIETGGDLFGLWIDEHTAAVQFVLGPGENCRRYPTSFFQDVNYLRNAGSYLTKAHGLCNIGQWHSHHRIRLFKPSAGDDNTVWNNMPGLGLDRYIVFIANIIDFGKVDVNCFLYQIKDCQKRPVKKGKLHELDANSPLRLNETLLQHVYDGAESFNKITVFVKEKQKVTNNDQKGNHNVSVENESGSRNYAGNGVQNTSGLSGGQNLHSYIFTHPTDKTKEVEHNPNEATKIASAHQIPVPVIKPVKSVVTYCGGSTIQTNQCNTIQSSQSEKISERLGGTSQQITSAASDRSTLNGTTSRVYCKENSPIIYQDPNLKDAQNVAHIVRTTLTGTQCPIKTSQNLLRQQDLKLTSSMTNTRDPQSVDTSLPEKREKQKHNERRRTATETPQNYNLPTPKDREKDNKPTTNTQANNKPTSSHELLNQQRETISPTNNLQRQYTSAEYSTNESETIVKQPERHSRKRESLYDNVSENNEPKFKKGRTITESNENLPTVQEKPSTALGTISAKEPRRKSKQDEKNCDVVRSANSLTDIITRYLCCKMSNLSIEDVTKASDVKEHRENKMDGDDKPKETYV